jgi:hypothetical protein
MRESILVINAGSSSIKFSVFETPADRSLSAGAHGQVEGIGTCGRRLADQTAAADGHDGAIAAIHEWWGLSFSARREGRGRYFRENIACIRRRTFGASASARTRP